MRSRAKKRKEGFEKYKLYSAGLMNLNLPSSAVLNPRAFDERSLARACGSSQAHWQLI
jgi:hypothetical protein